MLLGLVAAITLAPTAVDEPGKDALRAAAAACRQVSSVRYTVEQKAGPTTVTATIVQQRAEVPDAGQGGGRYCAKGTLRTGDGAETPFGWSYDGRTLRVMDVENGFVAVVDGPDAGDAGRLIGAATGLVVFSQFMDADGFLRMADKADRVEAKGEAAVAGEPCALVEVDQSFAPPGSDVKTTSTSTWGFARKDGLPRLFSTRSMRREITSLEINPEVKPADFVLLAPEGMEDRRVLRRAADTRGLLAVGAEAPAFVLQAAGGGEVSLADLKGKVVVLDFWATWCGPCRRAMPGIQSLRDKYPPDLVAVFGVSCSETKDADPGAFLKKQGFTYPTLVHGETISAGYKASGLPTVYIIDQAGKVIHAEKGFREGAEAQFVDVIDRALKR